MTPLFTPPRLNSKSDMFDKNKLVAYIENNLQSLVNCNKKWLVNCNISKTKLY